MTPALPQIIVIVMQCLTNKNEQRMVTFQGQTPQKNCSHLSLPQIAKTSTTTNSADLTCVCFVHDGEYSLKLGSQYVAQLHDAAWHSTTRLPRFIPRRVSVPRWCSQYSMDAVVPLNPAPQLSNVTLLTQMTRMLQ